MNLYLDDDSAAPLLVRLLQADGHHVLAPKQVGNAGKPDPIHLLWAVRNFRVLLTRNHDDFKLLHELVVGSGGSHSGLLVVRQDNDPKRDLKPQGIVAALRKLIKSGAPIADTFIILNHWR